VVELYSSKNKNWHTLTYRWDSHWKNSIQNFCNQFVILFILDQFTFGSVLMYLSIIWFITYYLSHTTKDMIQHSDGYLRTLLNVAYDLRSYIIPVIVHTCQ